MATPRKDMTEGTSRTAAHLAAPPPQPTSDVPPPPVPEQQPPEEAAPAPEAPPEIVPRGAKKRLLDAFEACFKDLDGAETWAESVVLLLADHARATAAMPHSVGAILVEMGNQVAADRREAEVRAEREREAENGEDA